MDTVLSDLTVSVDELKHNFTAVLHEAGDAPVVVLSHNRPKAYLLPAQYYQRLMNLLEDLEDTVRVQERAEGPFTEIAPEQL